ncbi:hypothetical protein [Enterobacter sp. AG326]|uniref:hypothetical protein n=1 Tax=Enterobacter sp. AG326 TaxID=2183902 RepID=UPI00105CA31C|nr:hypothetical protein [Enterobacter sp. AG326]
MKKLKIAAISSLMVSFSTLAAGDSVISNFSIDVVEPARVTHTLTPTGTLFTTNMPTGTILSRGVVVAEGGLPNIIRGVAWNGASETENKGLCASFRGKNNKNNEIGVCFADEKGNRPSLGNLSNGVYLLGIAEQSNPKKYTVVSDQNSGLKPDNYTISISTTVFSS